MSPSQTSIQERITSYLGNLFVEQRRVTFLIGHPEGMGRAQIQAVEDNNEKQSK